MFLNLLSTKQGPWDQRSSDPRRSEIYYVQPTMSDFKVDRSSPYGFLKNGYADLTRGNILYSQRQTPVPNPTFDAVFVPAQINTPMGTPEGTRMMTIDPVMDISKTPEYISTVNHHRADLMSRLFMLIDQPDYYKT